MPQAIQPDLAHQQRAVAGDGVQVGQVGVKPVRRFQIDVEADQVEKRELQVLGGGIVDVGEKPVGIFSPHRVRQPLEVPLDPAWSQPAYDRGGDLIAQGVAQQRRVAGDGLHRPADQVCDLSLAFLPVDQETQILFRRESHHHPQAVPRRRVEQGGWGHGVRNADRVEARGRHLRKVAIDDIRLVVFAPAGVRAKRPVGDAADEECLLAGEDKFAPHLRPDAHRTAEREEAGHLVGNRLHGERP